MYKYVCIYMYMYIYAVCFIGMHSFITLYTLQNENVARAFTSERRVMDMRRPDRRTPLKVLVDKSYKFTDDIWARYVSLNMESLE